MSIAPFQFKEFGLSEVEFISSAKPKSFLPTGRKKEEAPPPPPPPPIFSEEELKTAERDGYQKGFLDGIVEGKNQAANTQAEINQALGASVEGFAKQISPLFQLYRDMLSHQAGLLPQIAQAIAKKVAADALSENAYAAIEEVCMRCVRAMLHEPKLVITIHDSMQKTLEEKLKESAKSLKMAGEITVVGDAGIAPPNCRIEWNNGGMVRDTDALWQQVEQVVASMVTSGQREAEELCDRIEPAITQPTTPEGTNG